MEHLRRIIGTGVLEIGHDSCSLFVDFFDFKSHIKKSVLRKKQRKVNLKDKTLICKYYLYTELVIERMLYATMANKGQFSTFMQQREVLVLCLAALSACKYVTNNWSETIDQQKATANQGNDSPSYKEDAERVYSGIVALTALFLESLRISLVAEPAEQRKVSVPISRY